VAVSTDELYAKALDQATHVEQTFLELGASLRRLYDRDPELYHKVVEKSGLGSRKAYYLLAISKKFDKMPGIPKARLRALGWTKLQVIAKKLTVQNADELVTMAETNTVRDLEALLRGEEPKGDNARCVLMYFTPKQYDVYAASILKKGAYRSGRGIVNKEEALIKILKEHSLTQDEKNGSSNGHDE
jgi:hypothetical protein